MTHFTRPQKKLRRHTQESINDTKGIKAFDTQNNFLTTDQLENEDVGNNERGY